MYCFRSISESLKVDSLKKMVANGSYQSIKKQILAFLKSNPEHSYTASELTSILEIRHRSSVCKPLYDLVNAEMAHVSGSKYDHDTGREVGLYQARNTAKK